MFIIFCFVARYFICEAVNALNFYLLSNAPGCHAVEEVLVLLVGVEEEEEEGNRPSLRHQTYSGSLTPMTGRTAVLLTSPGVDHADRPASVPR